eukprot:6188845-Pleurochrysis_carterae.AAC.6
MRQTFLNASKSSSPPHSPNSAHKRQQLPRVRLRWRWRVQPRPLRVQPRLRALGRCVAHHAEEGVRGHEGRQARQRLLRARRKGVLFKSRAPFALAAFPVAGSRARTSRSLSLYVS